MLKNIHEFLDFLKKKGKLIEVNEELSTELEIAKKMHEFDGKPILFNKVENYKMKVCANLYCSKEDVAEFLGCKGNEITQKMIKALNTPTKNEMQKTEWKELKSLNEIPFLKHVKEENGKYMSSGFFVAKSIEGKINASFQRGMIFDSNKMVLRILERNLHQIIQESKGKIKVACVIGNTPNTLLGVATSVPFGVFELEIANTLQKLPLTLSPIYKLPVPANAEIILEGEINANELHEEGPFIDITGTLDIIRKQPVFSVEKIWVKENTVFEALLPGGLEHKMLMGTPREPTIFNEVNKVTKCLDVLISPGGCSWLHGIVKIEKQSEEDGKKAIEAAFKGHSSMKHCFVVSEDINIFDEKEIEWSMATRFQADKDLIIMTNQKGSSLDPSADPNTRITTKCGFDLTKPIGKDKDYKKVEF
ncbi:MAG: UbiD family decarboxylase [Candidatus Diapherotrites archaeon]|nr:UbiD family decarboxylase [Candidatus Diapherotrites archaeon]